MDSIIHVLGVEGQFKDRGTTLLYFSLPYAKAERISLTLLT